MINARNKFFKEIEITNTSFEKGETCFFDFRATGLIIACDGAGPIRFSYNGKDLDGIIYSTDKWVAFDYHDESKLWLAADVTTKVRVWAWEKRT